ncbi:glutamyl-tRNA reductase [Paenibacillus turicensis]|uniref:glutamyl-tRNA reductase n=1 Tax=Paenibacillus turicensis TaxID=160487 RepID=UPI003D288011
MHVMVMGLNYRTAPVEVRERFSFVESELPGALEELKHMKSVLEGVIIATCNRTEIYVVVDKPYMSGHYIKGFLEQWFGIPREEFSSYIYVHQDEAAIAHLFSVTCGLDSMVLGETQILGQVRKAFLLAQEQKATGTWFNRLFKQAITLGKRAHAETAIGENAVSVSYAAVELGKRIFGGFEDKVVLILGAGKMSELTVKHLSGGGAKKVLVANRTYARAQELAQQFNGTACTMQQAIAGLDQIDILISSTGSEGYVLTASEVAQKMGDRTNRPLFIVDIAVPRDIDPAIGELQHVYLYDIDDLEGIVESNMDIRRLESLKIEAMIETEIVEFQEWVGTLEVQPMIHALRQKSALIHESTMQSLFNKLPELDQRQQATIRRLTKSIINQMMHDPIHRIKEIAGEVDGADAIKMFAQIFALEDQLEDLEETSTESTMKKSPEAEPVLTLISM